MQSRVRDGVESVPTEFRRSFHGLRAVPTAHERVDGRASPSRRAAPRAWNTSGPARWGQARPTQWFMGSLLLFTGHELKTVRTAALRLLPAPLRSSRMQRLKGHGPKRRLMGSFHGLRAVPTAHERVDGRASPSRRAAPRAWNTSGPARWGQARPTVRFMGSSGAGKFNGFMALQRSVLKNPASFFPHSHLESEGPSKRAVLFSRPARIPPPNPERSKPWPTHPPSRRNHGRR